MPNSDISLSSRITAIEQNESHATGSSLEQAAKHRVIQRPSGAILVLEGEAAVTPVTAEMKDRWTNFIEIIEQIS